MKVLVQLKSVMMNKCSFGIWQILTQQLSKKFLFQITKIFKDHFQLKKNFNNDLNIGLCLEIEKFFIIYFVQDKIIILTKDHFQ